MITHHFLQLYWWALISLLGAILVFLMFVQGGQTLLFGCAKNEEQKKLIVNFLGHKWELTFTTLVTFGGAAFASFPLFYSTSFGGAYWLWILILLSFVIQAFSYEFRGKENNLFGKKTYDILLLLNGIAGTILIGVAVASFVTGGNFMIDKISITSADTISYWTNNYKGLELIANPTNLLLGVVIFLAARTLGLLYIINQCEKIESEEAKSLSERASSKLIISAIAFVLLFVLFVIIFFLSTGNRLDISNPNFNGIDGPFIAEKYAYLHNMLNIWWIAVIFLIGVLLVLYGLGRSILYAKSSFYVTGLGVVFAVWAILLSIGFCDMTYYPSLADINSSLTLYNSSSSLYTLKIMSYVSLAIPFVVLYIAYVWKKLSSK